MTVDAVVAAAKSQVGYRESGTNDTKFNHWLGRIPGYPHNGYGYAWCHSFVSWCLAQGGEAKAGPRTAGCEVGVAWFKARKRFSSGAPKVGDLVYYGANGGTHVELVVAVSASTITTVGGNTSGSLGGRYFNGDGVYKKDVARSSSRIYGYGHPAYVGAAPSPQPIPKPAPPPKPSKAPTFPGPVLKHPPKPPPMKKTECARRWQQRMRDRGWILDVDGYYGPDSRTVCRKFQADKALKVDGEVGPKTWAAAWTAPIT